MINRIYTFIAGAVMLLAGCAGVQYQADPETIEADIARLEMTVAQDPDNTELLRDLGVLCFEGRRYEKASEYLTKAFRNDRKDAKTMLYMGLSKEFLNQDDLALAIYQRYQSVSRLSPYRRLMEGRYRWLTRQKIRREIEEAMADESQLLISQVSPQTVAVFPMVYQGDNPRFVPLGKGISEMLITDLSKVKELRLLERIRIESLLAEIEFGQTVRMDSATAPRAGKILGAGKIVQGRFSVPDDAQLNLDVAAWDIVEQQFPGTVNASAELNRLFAVEKQIVFQLIDEMGIELTPEERREIEHIPTHNLQAFLAYSMGLEEADAGNFDAAVNRFESAIQMDPGFGAAQQELDATQSLREAGGSRDQAAAAAKSLDGGVKFAGKGRGLTNRLRRLSNNTRSHFLSGRDSRRGDGDIGLTGVGVNEDLLPEPPPPPAGQGGN